MDFKPGDIVFYIGCSEEQINWGNNSDPTGLLFKGTSYIIDRVEVHSQHTKLQFYGIEGKFNSVCFEMINDDTRRNA